MNEKAILYNKWGNHDQLDFCELPKNKSINPDTLKIKSNYLLIRVKAISVNPVDWKILSGSQRLIACSQFPRIFGSDFSGEVYNVGKYAEKCGFSVGDRVLGMVSPLTNGSGRQWLIVKAEHCIKMPETMSYNEAASLTAAGISSILATSFINRKTPGKVLLLGGGGGVGSLALQILSYNKWSITTVARAEQQELLKSLGSSHFIKRENWSVNLEKEWDAVIDGPGALIRSKPIQYLKRGGVYSPVYIPDSFIPMQIFRIFLWSFTSFTTGLFLAAPTGKRMKTLEELIRKGILRPVVDSVWKADQCREAVVKSIEGGVNGKIIIEMV